MSEIVRFNQVYTINYTYLKPSTRREYNDLYYIYEGNQNTIAVINTATNVATALYEPLTEEIEE